MYPTFYTASEAGTCAGAATNATISGATGAWQAYAAAAGLAHAAPGPRHGQPRPPKWCATVRVSWQRAHAEQHSHMSWSSHTLPGIPRRRRSCVRRKPAYTRNTSSSGFDAMSTMRHLHMHESHFSNAALSAAATRSDDEEDDDDEELSESDESDEEVRKMSSVVASVLEES